MNYYVYAHIRLDTNTVFYVGKGKRRRAYMSGSYRSLRWNNIVNAVGYRVEFIKTGLSEDEAFSLEREYIKYFKNLNQCQCNYSDGGQGNSGYKFTKSQREKLSKIQKSKRQTIINGHKKQAEKLTGRTKENHPGIKIISQKNSGTGNGRAIFDIITPDGIFDTIKQASLFYKISTSSIHKKINQKVPGWRKVLKELK